MLQDYCAEGSMFIVRFEFNVLVPKEGFEPTHPYGYYVLNVARLPFRHFGICHQRYAHPARSSP